LQRIKRSIDVSASIDAKCWVLHPGLKFKKNEKISQELNYNAISNIYDYAISAGLSIALENMPPNTLYYMVYPLEFEQFYMKTGIDINIVFDVGHANIAHKLNEFIFKFSKRFFEIHLHDNNGYDDSHLRIGDGSIDWKFLIQEFKKNKFQGLYMIEVIDRPFESLNLFKKMLFDIK
jgi:sugar phosphate isomerase/epimerase